MNIHDVIEVQTTLAVYTAKAGDFIGAANILRGLAEALDDYEKNTPDINEWFAKHYRKNEE